MREEQILSKERKLLVQVLLLIRDSRIFVSVLHRLYFIMHTCSHMQTHLFQDSR
jgi:hypothetical protein